MLDNIELVDREYNNASNTGRIHSNLIRLKRTSFTKVSEKYTEFRISLLNKKLDRVNKELEAEVNNLNFSGQSLESVENKILAKTSVIARLEEKIKVLSKENVPTNYVSNRAIKLKNEMINNAKLNSSSAYASDSNSNEVSFSPNDYGFSGVDTSANSVAFAAAGETSDIDVEKVAMDNEKSLSDDVNTAMNNQNDYQAPIDKDIIRSAIDESFSQLNNSQDSDNEDIYETPIYDSTENNSEDLSNLFTSSEQNIPDTPVENSDEVITTVPENTDSSNQEEIVSEDNVEKEESTISPISREEIENVINRKLEEQAQNDYNRVSSNESTQAKIDNFDENGEVKPSKYHYQPMSDEEIARARENIEYDKYEKIYEEQNENIFENNVPSVGYQFTAPQVAIDKPLSTISDVVLPHADVNKVDDDNVREDIVVTPDRDDYVSSQNTNDNDDIHFDYSEATSNDIRNAADVENSLGGLEALKARALKLREEQRKSKDELDLAKKEQSDEARRALEIKNATDNKKKDYEAYLGKLNDYCEALQQDIDINKNSVAAAKEDAESNRRFIKSQEMQMDDYDKMISDINSIISPEAINVRKAR